MFPHMNINWKFLDKPIEPYNSNPIWRGNLPESGRGVFLHMFCFSLPASIVYGLGMVEAIGDSFKHRVER
ncbi:hypothetical protein AQUCO_00900321v1 [Aquilegia coerulea]|uniref:Uncharacterized protein n=1 Tax=Aquilegia coerulea TaxID=218851 RepID=A0A2G5ED73_AQUCA|nr:hypothetical protein AQUCO_00900321v1 [Aquilegia coerulea]